MVDATAPALVIRTDDDWTAAIRFANQLVRSGDRVLQVGRGLDGDGSASFPPGSYLVPLTPTFDPGLAEPISERRLRTLAETAGVALEPFRGGAGLVATPVSAIRIGLYGGGGAPFNHAAILAACGFPIRFLSDAEIRAGDLATVDVLIIPGGGFRAMPGQLEPLGDEGCRQIADFVRRGGMYIGCCAGSYDCIVNSDAFLRTCPAQRALQLVNAAPWRGENAVEFLDLQSPGVGVVTVSTERPDHPVMYGLPPSFPLVHYNGPVLDPLADPVVEGASLAVGLATFTGWTERFTPAEAFAGPAAADKPTYLAQAIAAGRSSIVAGEFGLGRVVAFGSHPEFGLDLPMADWTAPARMLANAVLWQATARHPVERAPWSYREADGPVAVPRGAALLAVDRLATDLCDRAAALRARSLEPRPRWLTPAYALSVFGYPPDVIWSRSLADVASLTAEAGALARRLGDTLSDRVEPDDGPLAEAAMQVETWLLAERAPEWRQDAGYQGVLALLQTAIRKCEEALARWDDPLGPPAGPYGYADTSPYHLVAGSYLAAVGCTVGAVQLLRALVSEVDLARRLAGVADRDAVGVR